jgi:polar amino acid transport system substrate-binding protein
MTFRPTLRWCALLLCCLLAAGCASRAVARGVPVPTADPLLHNALPESVRSAGVLHIATDASYAPASSFGTDGHTIIGFEPDLGVALGQLLGVRVEFDNHSFDTLSGLLSSHATDLVMSAMTDTRDREKKVDFIDYFSAGTSIVVQRGNPSGIADLSSLCGRTVALERGTVQVDLIARAQHNCGGRPILEHLYGTNTDALVQVRTGRADAVLNDYPPAAALVSNARTGAYYQLASTAQYEPGPYGIGVAKDQPELRDTVAAALQRLMANGTYQRILAAWGVSAGALASVTTNAGQQ